MKMEEMIRRAARYAPDVLVPGARPARPPESMPTIGMPVSRVDGSLKVLGKAKFSAEVAVQGLLHAAVVHSSVARGRIASLDTRAAECSPGVALVMTHRNAPRLNSPPAFMMDKGGCAGSDLPVMQDDRIHWNGEAVAVVLADTMEQADHAASLIEVGYAEETAATDFEASLDGAHHPESVLGQKALEEIGNAEGALAEAAHRVDQTYRTPFMNHNALELHVATVEWQGDSLTLHDATQMITMTAANLAKVFGLKPEQVRVLSPFVGGGFGGKSLWSHQILAAAASRLANRPVRLVLSRAGVYRLIGGRTTTLQRVALGAAEDGHLTALVHTGTAAMTAHNNCPEQFTFPARHLYAADTFKFEQKVVDLDMLANTWMRAPGESVGTFALESAIDELAHQMKVCPIELRRRWEPAADPTTGNAHSSRHLLRAYAEGAHRFGWQHRDPIPGQRREGEWRIGMGVATATYPYYRMPGIKVRLRLDANGSASVTTAAHEMGMGTATAQTQHAADRLALPFDRVTFEYGDSRMPAGPYAGGSSQTAGTIAAVSAAVDALFDSLLKCLPKGHPLAGLSSDEVMARDEGLMHRGDPDRRATYSAMLSALGEDALEVEAGGPQPMELLKYSMHSTGAQFAEVAVSEVTGEVRVRRFLGSFDCGRILNPKTAASQFRGGIIMGIGMALMERTLLDPRTGRVANASLSEYHVPVHLDVPPIDVMWTDEPDPHTPLGVRGIGEIGITGTAAAIANAVFNATGKRVRELPITLDKLL